MGLPSAGPRASDAHKPCAIILAGGEGMRLRPLVQRLLGFGLPKQFVSFDGRRTLLEATCERVERLVEPERIFIVVGEEHLSLPGVAAQLEARPTHTVARQPSNRDTGPGLLLPLMHLMKMHQDSPVVVFPSDHFVRDEDRFMAHVADALLFVDEDPASIVLLGVEPHEPEPEYGYVLPRRGGQGIGLSDVAHFIEKPKPNLAARLVAEGGLWNTLVMAFRPETFLDLARRVAPALCARFDAIRGAIATPREAAVTRDIYRDLDDVNLSRDLLGRFPEIRPGCLRVLRVGGVGWSDCGSERRIAAAQGVHDELRARSPALMEGGR